jgi:hypothetical protein
MKVLLFLTSHRQLEEVHLYGEYIKKFCPIVKTFDLLFHINKIDIDISKVGNYFQSLPFENKTLILTSKNAGYTFGGIEAVADCFDLLKDYDYVIHSHPDVFLTKDDIIGKILEYFSYSDKVFIVNKSWGADHKWMSFDFFIFKPKFVTTNIFADWPKYIPEDPAHIENVLFDLVTKYNIPYQHINRYDTDHWMPRRVDMLGTYHEHDLDKVRLYLNNNRSIN